MREEDKEMMKYAVAPIQDRVEMTKCVMNVYKGSLQDAGAFDKAMEERKNFITWSAGYAEAVKTLQEEDAEFVEEEIRNAINELNQIGNPIDGWC